MNKPNKQCLEYLDYYLYSKHITKRTIASKESTHLLINHLIIKDSEGINKLLNKILLLAEQKDNLLVHSGLQNIIIQNYPKEIEDFIKSERMRSYLSFADD